jgi:hypothetical protein
MCKIDAAFAAISLDEKIDPLERFTQALDEALISRNFRALLLKCFAFNWSEILGNITSVEHLLDAVSASENDLVNLISFITNDSISFRLRHVMRCILDDSQSVNSHPLFLFVVDAAREFSNGSPFDLYYSNLAAALGMTRTKLLWFVFGNNYITDNFFNAEALKRLHPDERTEKLWRFFCETTKSKNCASDTSGSELCLTPKELLALIDSAEGPPTEQTHRLLKGFEFLKRWMELDAKAGIFHHSYGPFFRKLYSELSVLESLVSSENSHHFKQWRRGIKKDIELAFLSNVDVATATDDRRQLWAEKMEQHFSSFGSDWIAYSDLPHETRQQRCLEEDWAYLDALILKLTPTQYEVWIQFSIDNFVNDALNNVPFTFQKLDGYGRWCFGNTYTAWKSLFIAALDRLSIEQQLVVLSHHMLLPVLPKSVDQAADVSLFLQEHVAWWNNLLLGLKAKDGFTKSLLPKWIIAVWSKCSSSELLTDIDNCIGYLRGVVNKPVTSEAQSQVVQHQLKTLLGYLDSQSPEKSLKHRLMLMRASQIPLADEGLNYRWQFKDAEWYSPLSELSKALFVKETGPCNLLEMEQAQTVFYTRFSKAVADFCLSRLRLRKGEKALDGKYEQAQCTELSAIWRQGYLKALSEIGLDLDGQVHQTVNFVKENDPDPDVRTIAKEAYKSVRRQSSSPRTYVDYVRGIVAAEWWLLMCQRQSLELDIDQAAALNTRRKLLRNP